MIFNSKLLRTVFLGAAAYCAYKYMNMTEEEKTKLASDLKNKANNFKGEALKAEEHAMEYFKDLSHKGGDAVKEYFPKVKDFVNNIFGDGYKAGAKAASENMTTPN